MNTSTHGSYIPL